HAGDRVTIAEPAQFRGSLPVPCRMMLSFWHSASLHLCCARSLDEQVCHSSPPSPPHPFWHSASLHLCCARSLPAIPPLLSSLCAFPFLFPASSLEPPIRFDSIPP